VQAAIHYYPFFLARRASIGFTSNLKPGMNELAHISLPTSDCSYFKLLGNYKPTHFFNDLSANMYP
jgi:hypothetical protein